LSAWSEEFHKLQTANTEHYRRAAAATIGGPSTAHVRGD
jgi:hypothetical protein